jgi:two-component system NtrC family response regulator
MANILLVEDDQPQRETLAGFLSKRGYRVHQAASAGEAEEQAGRQEVDLLLTDLRLGGPDGISLLEKLKQGSPDLQALVLTAYGTVEDAVRAMRAGAYDFLAKPVDLDRLELLVEKALERVLLARENRGLREAVKSSTAFADLIGESESMGRVKELAAKVAASRAAVLIRGESGTGKEVLARSIHLASPRRHKPFVVVNCAALPETLIESELFGHEKGAFTGATRQKRGRFELADLGTLFLDEVGDIGRDRDYGSGRAYHNRHPSRSGGAHPGRDISRGPVLPAQRGLHRSASAARAPRGSPCAGGPLPAQVYRPVRQADRFGRARGTRSPEPDGLSRQRSGAGKLDRAGHRIGRGHAADPGGLSLGHDSGGTL